MAPEEVNSSAVVLVLATPSSEQPDWSVYAMKARPSYADEGQPFELSLSKADAGELDFVWALGDLVDFVHIGLVTREPTDNNWSTLIDLFINCPHERERGNEGLRVPLYTTLGNHDWRAYPYPPDLTVEIFGISKTTANELDYLVWRTAISLCWIQATTASRPRAFGTTAARRFIGSGCATTF